MVEVYRITNLCLSGIGIGLVIGLMVGYFAGTAIIKSRMEEGKINLSRFFTLLLIPAWLTILALQFLHGFEVPNIVHIIFGIPIGNVFGIKITEIWKR